MGLRRVGHDLGTKPPPPPWVWELLPVHPLPTTSPWDSGPLSTTSSHPPSSVGRILPPASHLSGCYVLLTLWLVGDYVCRCPSQNRFHPGEGSHLQPSSACATGPSGPQRHPHRVLCFESQSVSDVNALNC